MKTNFFEPWFEIQIRILYDEYTCKKLLIDEHRLIFLFKVFLFGFVLGNSQDNLEDSFSVVAMFQANKWTTFYEKQQEKLCKSLWNNRNFDFFFLRNERKTVRIKNAKYIQNINRTDINFASCDVHWWEEETHVLQKYEHRFLLIWTKRYNWNRIYHTKLIHSKSRNDVVWYCKNNTQRNEYIVMNRNQLVSWLFLKARMSNRKIKFQNALQIKTHND